MHDCIEICLAVYVRNDLNNFHDIDNTILSKSFHVDHCVGELITNGTESMPVVLQPANSTTSRNQRFRGITIRQYRRGLY